MSDTKLLEGVKVVELATFFAAATAGKFLADAGADVIKVEAPAGDLCRYTAASEGRPYLPNENTTWELQNGNKRGLSLNLKDKDGMEAMHRLLETADVFITNWRVKALEKIGLDYETLKERYPKLVYGILTGYGDFGPAKDLPGFDSTAFFARGGYQGCLRPLGGQSLNIAPGMGDHNAGMNLAAGVLAALYHAKMTGKGERVQTSLYETAVFNMAIMIQSRQFGLPESQFPLDSSKGANPVNNAFETKDDRAIQFCFPNYDIYFKSFAEALGRPELAEDDRYFPMASMKEKGTCAELYEIIRTTMRQKTAKEWMAILEHVDFPYALAQNFDELLEDEQAWANDCYYKMKYDNGNERVVCRQPVKFREVGLPETNRGPKIGEHGVEILKELGYEDGTIDEMLQSGSLYVSQK